MPGLLLNWRVFVCSGHQRSEWLVVFLLYNPIMAIRPTCDKCNEELKEFGGILLSPPNREGKVRKFHLCVACYTDLVKEFNNK